MVDFGTPPLQYANSVKEAAIFATIKAMTLGAASKSKLVLPGSDYIARATGWITRPGHSLVSHSGIIFHKEDGDSYNIGRPYVLYVGRHVEYKQVDRLIHIFKEVNKTVPEALLITVGNIPRHLESYYQLLCKNNKNVRMLGYVDDVWMLYRGASVYANCSLWEGEDRPALEAQSCGTPAVAFDNSDHPETIVNGKCVKTDKEFADALIYYLQRNGKDHCTSKYVRSEYSVESVVKKWTAKYRELI
jgi:glycosyltransferase involved in cell wall biosynthesis